MLLTACGEEHKHVGQKEVVAKPLDIDEAAADIIKTTLDDVEDSDFRVQNFSIYDPNAVAYVYKQQAYKPIWSRHGAFVKGTDSLFHFIADARRYALFPDDYYKARLDMLRKLVTDTTKENKLDAAKWAESDLLLTAA